MHEFGMNDISILLLWVASTFPTGTLLSLGLYELSGTNTTDCTP